MILGVIELAFDPLARFGALAVPWQVLGIATACFVALIAAALIARREAAASRLQPLRLDDLLFVALAAVPGGVVGGRIVHGITFLDFYARDPLALLDTARGSLSLLGAVLGGSITAAYVANLLDGHARRWAGVAAVPLLLGIGLGKFGQLLGGGGQGLRFDGPWAVALTGPGPWLAPSPDVPAHPSQVYEAVWTLFGIPLTLLLWAMTAGPPDPPPSGDDPPPTGGGRTATADGWAFRWTGPASAFLLAVAWWLLGRVLIGFTWRDERVIGPLGVEQALALGAFVLVGGVLVVSALDPFGGRRDRRPQRAGGYGFGIIRSARRRVQARPHQRQHGPPAADPGDPTSTDAA